MFKFFSISRRIRGRQKRTGRIVAVLKEGEKTQLVADICREHGISNAKFISGRASRGVSDLTRMKELEDENIHLKKMYADLALKTGAIRDLLGKF